MEIQSISNVDGYNLFIQDFPGNLYHLNIVDPDKRVYQFEGIYSSPQAAIEKGQTVIKNFQFWRERTPKSRTV